MNEPIDYVMDNCTLVQDDRLGWMVAHFRYSNTEKRWILKWEGTIRHQSEQPKSLRDLLEEKNRK